MKLYARLTEQGTAAHETAVCEDHLAASVPSDDTVTEPVDCTGNDDLKCIVCGLPSRLAAGA